MATDGIGWAAAVVLLATLGRQVYAQWRAGTSVGVSRWLFLGQLSASTGFVIYSWLLANWVFVVTNALILATALLGQWIYLRNRRRDGGVPDQSAASAEVT
jgi:MtN3 and saliva related transmembrane protein